MKQGRSLMELAQELDRQAKAKRDLIGDTRQCAVRPVKEKDAVDVDQHLILQVNGEDAPINQHALRQIGDRLQIPAKYVDRLAANHPDMLAYNINALFSREPERRLIRMLDGNVRAFLSDRYRVIDNWDVASVVLDGIKEFGAEVGSCEVTEKRLYIKATIPGLKAEIPAPKNRDEAKGLVPDQDLGPGHEIFVDSIVGGIVIKNSEVGCGSYAVEPATFTARCTNLAIFNNYAFRKFHVGRKNGGDEDQFREFYQDDTRLAEDATLFKKIRDITRAAMDGKIFDKIKTELIEARGQVITKPINEFVEVAQKKFGLLESETKGVLDHLIRGGDFTKYGVHSAVTLFANDVDGYDRATELEAVGGEIIELRPNEWTSMAVAKAA